MSSARWALLSAPAFERALADVVVWVLVGESLLVLVLVFRLFWIRISRSARERHRLRIIGAWRREIVRAVHEERTPPAPPAGADSEDLLSIWNEYHSLLDGSAQERLNEFAQRAGIAGTARRMLASNRLKSRLLALTAIANLRDRSFVTELHRFAKDRDPSISFIAVKALVRIHPDEAIVILVQALAARDDWSTAQVAVLLREAGPACHSAPLAGAALTASFPHRSRLVRLLEGAQAQEALPAVRRILDACQDEETICACLLVIGRFRNPKDLDLVRSFLNHSSANVRIRAVTALGQICENEDRAHLVQMLSDREWWVRYRAAQALACLPGMDRPQMGAIQSEHADFMARDIIDHVLAEESLR